MKADLVFLASDSMRGRLTGTPENRLAAEWIAARFDRLGLVPAGQDGSYFQTYDLVTASAGTDNAITIRGARSLDGGAPDPTGEAPGVDGLAATGRAGHAVGLGLAMTIGDLVPGHLSAQHLGTSLRRRLERYARAVARLGDDAHRRRVTSITLRFSALGSKIRP